MGKIDLDLVSNELAIKLKNKNISYEEFLEQAAKETEVKKNAS